MAGSAFHTIMLPVRPDGKGEGVLARAAILARRFGSHVRVVHCQPTAEDLLPQGVVIPAKLRFQIEDAVGANAEAARSELVAGFRDLALGLGLAEEAAATGKPSVEFVTFDGKQVDAVRHFGRLADLICVPKPDADDVGANTLKSALFSSGRPVLMCPLERDAPGALGRHVAIGWNGSLEATRAVGLAMPLIEAAKSVTILAGAPTDQSATAEGLQRYLAAKGVTAAVRMFEAEGGVGRVLLQTCEAIGADVLIMGAYHDHFERESMFGGNSQAVVEEAEIPVVFVH